MNSLPELTSPTGLLSRLRQFAQLRPLWTYAAAGTLTSYLLFVLPYAFPPPLHPRLISISYVFGFNNKVAILGLVAVVLLVSLAKTAPVSSTLSASKNSRPHHLDRTLVRLWIVAAVWYLFLTVTLYFVVAKPDGYYKLDWESSQFIWHAKMMYLYGLRPYRDFVMEYGPALAYLPTWTYLALRPLGMSFEASYYVLHYLLNLVGLTALVYLVDSFSIRPAYKRVAFCLVALSAFSLPMGLNGLLIRYLLPYIGLLLVHTIVAGNSDRTRRWHVIGAVAAVTTVALVTSPEIAIACAAALTVYALGLFAVAKQLAIDILLAEACLAVLAILVLPDDYFHSVVSFANGGNNIPIASVVHIVFYVAVVLVCIPSLLASRLLSRSAADSYACALGVASLAMIPPALGRCDASHVFLNGLGLFTVAFALFARWGRRPFVAYSIAYGLVAVLFFQLSNVRTYGISRSHIESGIHRLTANLNKFVRPSRPALHAPQGNTLPPNTDNQNRYAGFEKYAALGLPYGTYGYEKSLQTFLWQEKRVIPEKYMGAVGVYDESQVQELLDEFNRMPLIVIESNFLKLYENRDLCKEQQNALLRNLLAIRVRPCLNQPLDPNVEMAKFIDSHYHLKERIGDYLVMERAE